MNQLCAQRPGTKRERARNYVIEWQKRTIVLRPEALVEGESTNSTTQLNLDKGYAYVLRLPAALQKGPFAQWTFWPSGTCETGEREIQRAAGRVGGELFAADRAAGDRSLCCKVGDSRRGFALYEVLLGLAVFIIRALALGRSVENCLNASMLSEEDNRVRLVLAQSDGEIQSSPVHPDASKEEKVDTGYGIVKLVQKSKPEELQEPDNTIITGITRVTLDGDLGAQRSPAEQAARVFMSIARAKGKRRAGLRCSRSRSRSRSWA